MRPDDFSLGGRLDYFGAVFFGLWVASGVPPMPIQRWSWDPLCSPHTVSHCTYRVIAVTDT